MSKTRLSAFLPIAVAIALFGAAAPAAAHTGIEGTVPADGETVTVLPEHFSATASAELNDLTGTGDGFEPHIIGPDGIRYDTGEILIEGQVASTPAAVGDPGTYTLAYQVVGEDGHPVAGEAVFTWAPDGANDAADATDSTDAAAPSDEMTTNAQDAPATIAADDDGLGWVLPVGIVVAVLILGTLVAVLIAKRRTA